MNAGAALCAVLALGSALAAQAGALEVHLAADPHGDGPAAWTWVRDSVLPRVDRDAPDVDLRAALWLRVTEDGDVAFGPGDPPERPVYATLTLRADGAVVAEGSLEFDGTERWTAKPLEGALPSAIRTLVSRFGYEATTGWIELDLPAAAGNLMAGAIPGDLVGDLLTLGALECGAVGAIAREADDGTMRIVGRSGGGVALPAMILAIADGQARRESSRAPLAEDLEHWLLLAATARAEEQEEAARQLARFDDPRSITALERLLHADGRVRLVAMHALGRLRAIGSLGAIALAATPDVPGSAEVAARVLGGLLPPAVQDAMMVRSGSSAPPAPAAEMPAPRIAAVAVAGPPIRRADATDREWLVALLAGGSLLAGLAGGALLASLVTQRGQE